MKLEDNKQQRVENSKESLDNSYVVIPAIADMMTMPMEALGGGMRFIGPFHRRTDAL